MPPKTGRRFVVIVAAAAFGCGGGTNDAGDHDAMGDAAVVPMGPVDCGAPNNHDAALPPGVLASWQAGPGAIAVDDSYVYWVTLGSGGGGGKSVRPFMDGQVMRCEKGGCGNRPTELVSGITHGPELVVALAVDHSNVYFDQSQTGIMACAKGGCDAGPTRVSPDGAGQLAADGNNLYWTASAEVMQSPIQGGASITLYSGSLGTSGIAIDATDVYFTTIDGSVKKCAIGGCNNAPTTLVAGPFAPTLLTIDATSVYWIVSDDHSDAQIMKCAKSGCSSPTLLATNRYDPQAIATDGTDVYWIELGKTGPPDYTPVAGSIFRCATHGCNGTPSLVAGEQTGMGTLAVDSAHLYWSRADECNGAQIMMTAK